MEIRNPGLLYGGLTIEQIKNEMVSERRNEVISDMFHRVHYVEKWGRGISLILSREPDADFKEVGTHFITVFKRKGYKAMDEKITKPKTTQKTTQKQKAILEYLKKHSTASREELTQGIENITIDGVKYNLKRLQEIGLLRRVGADRGGYWKVLGNNDENS